MMVMMRLLAGKTHPLLSENLQSEDEPVAGGLSPDFDRPVSSASPRLPQLPSLPTGRSLDTLRRPPETPPGRCHACYIPTERPSVVPQGSGVATARHPFPCKPISCILLANTNCHHVFPHDIHQPSLWSSSSSLAWQLHPHHPSTNLLTISPLDVSKPSKSVLSNFVSKRSNLGCRSDELISNLIQPGHPESEPQHLQFRHLQLCVLLSLQCHCL
ncbi:uncharacterized protein LOC133416441 [Phycodurus eques]|uniref:uncharacterized protein LOC133416441 n=1 Tax=Phycodurus eques TaxID=693459 RepID=UPI002ACED5FA|nr:uncharacterized protein LOC133416441 [Phycodurus eques]